MPAGTASAIDVRPRATMRSRTPSFFQSLFGSSHGASPEKKYSLASLTAQHASLSRVTTVNEKNMGAVVESIRAIAELVIWGEKHDPAIFEFFLEKNVLGVFWRILAQEKTPLSVKQQCAAKGSDAGWRGAARD